RAPVTGSILQIKTRLGEFAQGGVLATPLMLLGDTKFLHLHVDIDENVKIVGRSETLPRFPPRPLLYTTFSNAARILLPERRRLTFVLATASPGIAPRELATRIHTRMGLRARAPDDFKADTVRWYLSNSEDVGDIAAMLSLAMSVGFGVTGIMLYMFTNENLKQYAVLKATSQQLLAMIFAQ